MKIKTVPYRSEKIGPFGKWIGIEKDAQVEALGFEPRSAGFHHEGSYPPRN